MENAVSSIVERAGKKVVVRHNPKHEDRVFQRDSAGGLEFTPFVEGAIDDVVRGDFRRITETVGDDRVFEAQLL